jgi:nicotinamidase-related amidase
VREAALGAYALGLRVFIATDAAASYDPAHARLTLAWLHERAAHCAPTAAVLALAEAA